MGARLNRWCGARRKVARMATWGNRLAGVAMALAMGSMAGITGGCVAETRESSSTRALHENGDDGDGAKNVILFIGDGMGLQQISLLTLQRRTLNPTDPPTSFERLMNDHHYGLADTYMLDGLAVDSAASATQIACGVLTRTQVIGLNAQGYPCYTVLEHAHALGKATGLITDTRVTHATPAAFAAKQVWRRFEPQIADDLITGVSRDKVQVILGGGARYLIPQGTRFSDVPGCTGIDGSVDGSSSRGDAVNVIAQAQANDYEFACTAQQLADIPSAAGTKVLGLFARSGFPAYPQRASVPGIPTILEMTSKTIDILDKDPQGFFLMVEAGQIDWGAHENDPAYVLEAMKRADETVLYLMDYVEQHPDTLLIVTADHETGGMGFSYHADDDVVETLPSGLVHTNPHNFADAAAAYDFITRQTMSYGAIINPVRTQLYQGVFLPNPNYPIEQAIQDLMDRVAQYTAHTITEEQAMAALFVPPGSTIIPMPAGSDKFFFDSPWQDRLSMQLGEDTKMVWATGTHTSTPVPVMAMGPADYASRVNGYRHLTDVAHIIFAAMNDGTDDSDSDRY